jgi:hypothetical protein
MGKGSETDAPQCCDSTGPAFCGILFGPSSHGTLAPRSQDGPSDVPDSTAIVTFGEEARRGSATGVPNPINTRILFISRTHHLTATSRRVPSPEGIATRTERGLRPRFVEILSRTS